jgi:protein-tyrosine-phosphatase
MTRVGKIARLPKEVRDEVNRRIEEGHEAKQIILWLNSLEDVKRIMAKMFGGEEVTDSNLSNWKSGGYKDWVNHKTTLEAILVMRNHAAELAEETADNLTDILAAQAAADTLLAMRALQQETATPQEKAKTLDRLYRRLLEIRRGDHHARRIKIEAARQKTERDRFKKLNQPKEIALKTHGKRKTGGISEEALREIEEACNLL